MMVRLGLPKSTGRLPLAAERLGAPVLISANSLWVPGNEKREGYFREPGMAITDLDVALDSAGFVAAERYGGYRWAVEKYVGLAGMRSWAWWAQMDLCCEPELPDGTPNSVRIWANAWLLAYCRKVAKAWQPEFPWLQDPMPVLQGWYPHEYRQCAHLYAGEVLDEWPVLVGIGSVCRRNLHGEAGLFNVLDEVQRNVPEHVHFHLFGVKGAALKRLRADYPRVVSTDSAAWDFRARYDTPVGESCTIEHRVRHMKRWYENMTETT